MGGGRRLVSGVDGGRVSGRLGGELGRVVQRGRGGTYRRRFRSIGFRRFGLHMHGRGLITLSKGARWSLGIPE